MATPFYATINDTTSCVGVLDSYDAMILEYIEEKHIAAYSLLSHDRTAATQPHHTSSSTGIPSQNSRHCTRSYSRAI
ncbi:hypothetical protein DAEQUDRAFT_721509 [Daedalea quercina L-15889]|uniref:Uncharacterized protein n=1 Tax=Daedalea quercina L-15889 TaxID=1314783 RepID=A0A165THV2_9APHY|nr:hypothetical protein DAEQUDRAFT_721509 [Daedalea quercina L-15889]